MLKITVAALLVGLGAGFVGGAFAQRAGLPHDVVAIFRPDPPPPSDGPWYEFKSAFERRFPVKANIVMVGDSITESGDWSGIFPAITIANYGISNDTTGGVLRRMDAILLTGAKTAFTMLGINDIRHGVPIDETVASYREIIKDLRTAGMTVYVQSTLFTDRPEERAPVEQINRALSGTCLPEICTFIDLNHKLAPGGSLRSLLTIDGTHLNAQGYADWRDVIMDVVH